MHRHQPIYLLAALASLLLLGTLLHLRLEPRNVSSVLEKVAGRPIFEIEGFVLGPRFIEPSHAAADTDPLGRLLRSLKLRFRRTTFPDDNQTPGYPNCTLNLERYTQIAFESRRERVNSEPHERRSAISFAINLRNSESIIPAQAVALLEAISHLLPKNRVYVSIYENDSDDKTRLLLSDVGAALQAIGIDGLWMRSSNMRSAFDTQDRIVMLSEIRNLALAPLIPYASSGTNDGTLLFVNDVITCTSDILELIHQQRLHKAGMAFGMDWGTVDRNLRPGEVGYLDTDDPEYDLDNQPKMQVTRYYDAWVGRGIGGGLVDPWALSGGYHPMSGNESWVTDAYLPENDTTHQRWLDGRALPVYSGWGGMSAFDASLFTHEHLRFRSSVLSGWVGGSQDGALGAWGQLVSSAGYLESDCPGASECEHIARDIWNLRHSDAHIVLAPQTRTTYNIQDWLVMSVNAPATRHEEPKLLDEDAISWEEVSIPQSVVCIASRNADGESLDLWNEDNHRTRLDQLWKPANGTA